MIVGARDSGGGYLVELCGLCSFVTAGVGAVAAGLAYLQVYQHFINLSICLSI